MRSAVISNDTNIVVTILITNADSIAPDGCYMVNVDERWCDIGWLYDPVTDQFAAPEEAP